MATTINSYSVSLGMDASSYIKASTLSRRETNSLIRDINKARTPAENYGRQVGKLEKALKSGAIEQKTFNRLVQDARSKYLKAADATKKMAASQQSLNSKVGAGNGLLGSITGSIKTFAAGYVGVNLLTSSFASLREEMQRVDQVAKTSRAFGETLANTERFQFAASEIAGVGGQQSVEMLGKMVRRIGEAKQGIGEAGQAFELLNLKVERLEGLGPVEQFQKIAEAFKRIEDNELKVVVASKLFEESGSKLIPLLDSSAVAFEESAINAEKLGLAISEIEVENIEATNDAFGRLDAATDGLWRTISTEFSDAPQVLDAVSASLVGFGKTLQLFLRIDKDIRNLSGANTAAFFGSLSPKATDFGFGKRAGLKGASDIEETTRALTDTSLTDGLMKGAREGISDASEAFAGTLQGFYSGVEQLAATVTTTLDRNHRETIQVQKESPAIRSLEVGTQEAYAFMNESIASQLDEQKQEAKRQEAIKKNGERLLETMQRAVEVFEDNGWGRV